MGRALSLLSIPWSFWILAALVLVTWVAAWRGSRRFRLWFAVLAPIAAIGGIVLGVALTIAQGPGPCVGRQCGSVAGFAAGLDNPTGIDAMLQANSLLALFVAAPLSTLTLIVEFVLLVRRQNREAAEEAAARR